MTDKNNKIRALNSVSSEPAPQLTMDALRERIRDAFKKWDEAALKKQKKAIQFARLSALLIPFAVLLLTIQILAFPSPGILAIILIAVELSALLCALLILICRLGPRAGDWAHERLRAEVLRREEFLLLARVGPYLKKSTLAELESALNFRLAHIDNPIKPPDLLLPLRDGQPWCYELEEAGQGNTATPETGFSDIFIKDRVLHQRNWFWTKRNKFNDINWRYENIIRGTLAFALVFAAMHLISLLVGTYEAGKGHPWLRLIIEVAAITMPPIGSAAAALQSLFQGRRLGRSYKVHALELDVINEGLISLMANHKGIEETLMKQPDNEERRRKLKEEKDSYEFQFKRLVLRTEELLSNELKVWYFVMRPGIQ